MYQALYRKWRPRTFSDVVGQNAITQTLRRQVAGKKTSHAYLFTGSRGTGKTSCAKILAKAVNCESPQNGDPCCRCPTCLGIDSGSILDVLELDAASNNGVDQIRSLRDEAVYMPSNGIMRVYIVDEVHMLSAAAFNALLKILEEPPAHLMFILATTEMHKIPATILSRCQRYAFKRISGADIQKRVLYIAEQEHINLTPDGAELLSRMADGALRDALSLLDQCAAAGGTIDSQAVREFLGLSGQQQTRQLMRHVLTRNAKEALILLNQLYQEGRDMSALLHELRTLIRDILLIRITRSGALLSGGFAHKTLEELGQGIPDARLMYMADTLRDAKVQSRTDAEFCVLRLCDETLSGDLSALNARVVRLEAGVPDVSAHQFQPPVKPAVQQNPAVSVNSPVRQRPSVQQSSAPPGNPVRQQNLSERPNPTMRQNPSVPIHPAAPTSPAAQQKSTARTDMSARTVKPGEAIQTAEQSVSFTGTYTAPSAAEETVFRKVFQKSSSPISTGVSPRGEPPPSAPENDETDLPWEAPGAMPWEEQENLSASRPGSPALTVPPSAPASVSVPAAENISPDISPEAVESPPQQMSECSDSSVPSPAQTSEQSQNPAVSAIDTWLRISETCKRTLPIMYKVFFEHCTGMIADQILTVYTPDEITFNRLNNDRVLSILSEVATQETGQEMRVLLRTGMPPDVTPEDRFRRLIDLGRQQGDVVKII